MTTREEYQARRKAWVEALRSGKYQQTKSMLYDGDGFCCLGVACDISKLGDWELADESDVDVGAHNYVCEMDVDAVGLPDDVRDWLGLKNSSGQHLINGGKDYETLPNINDHEGKSFSEIADLIEQRAADLFIPEAL